VASTDTQADDGPTLSATRDPERKLSDGSTLAASHDATDAPNTSESGPIRLGRYVLLTRLGAGGMGVVYVAYDEQLDRKVALKLLHSRGSDHAQLRLVREAQALARLSHPNVVQIYEIAEARVAEQAYLVMEFIDGLTLGAWMRERPRTRA
jgi:eukaryotic-like serine/threonine-protein kinase